MITILVLLAALLALLYGAAFSAREPSWSRSAVKTGAVAFLALSSPALGAPPLITAGLALGAAGDFFLSRPGTPAFLAGMGAFALGHICYALAFYTPGSAPAVGVALALGLLALSTELWLAPRTGSLKGPVRAYVVVIIAMALAALTLPQGRTLALAGALLFVFSDLLLALDLFVLPKGRARSIIGPTLWAAYWGGQVLILIGMLPQPVA